LGFHFINGDVMKKLIALLAIFALANLALANPASDEGVTRLKRAVGSFCGALKDLLPVVSMLMVVVAGVIYAAGQIMGAETRARANVWATSCLTGAIIGILIATIAPEILNILLPGVSGAC
jgi:hypothetical protein